MNRTALIPSSDAPSGSKVVFEYAGGGIFLNY